MIALHIGGCRGPLNQTLRFEIAANGFIMDRPPQH
jgi:hypothetical protein